MPSRPLPAPARRVVAGLLVAWLVVLAVTLLAPSAAGPSWLVETVAGVAADLGVPAALADPTRVEFLLNVAAFVPASFLGSLLWDRLTWRDWTAGGFVASFLVEVAQALVLDHRSATHADVVANTLGALVGALAGAVVVRHWGGRDRSHHDRRHHDRG